MAGKSNKGKGKGKSTNKAAPPDLAASAAGLGFREPEIVTESKPLQNPENSETAMAVAPAPAPAPAAAAKETATETQLEDGEIREGEDGTSLEGEGIPLCMSQSLFEDCRKVIRLHGSRFCPVLCKRKCKFFLPFALTQTCLIYLLCRLFLV